MERSKDASPHPPPLQKTPQGMQRLQPQLTSVHIPLYIVHGGRDLTTSYDAVDKFSKQASSTDVTFKHVEGAHSGGLAGCNAGAAACTRKGKRHMYKATQVASLCRVVMQAPIRYPFTCVQMATTSC